MSSLLIKVIYTALGICLKLSKLFMFIREENGNLIKFQINTSTPQKNLTLNTTNPTLTLLKQLTGEIDNFRTIPFLYLRHAVVEVEVNKLLKNVIQQRTGPEFTLRGISHPRYSASIFLVLLASGFHA